jgi:hypothetical protein
VDKLSPKAKVHFPRFKRTEEGNYVMFCGKVFSAGDRKRLKKHVTSHIEYINCRECVGNMIIALSSNVLFEKTSD